MSFEALPNIPINLKNQIRMSGDNSPTALAGDVDDYNPTGASSASVLRIDGGVAGRNITGLVGGFDGRIITILNVGTTNSLTLVQQSASSVAANRFIGPNDGNIVIRLNGGCMLIYDATSSRWRTVGYSI